MSSLSRRMAGAAVWMIAARMFMRFSGLINVMILARLLPPADFGVVGLTVAFLAAFEAMSDMSLNAALVRHPDPQRKHYDTVWTLMVLRGMALGGIAIVAAEPMADFYGDPRLASVAYALGAQQILLGLMNPGVADFQRDFSFGRDFSLIALRKVASVGICVTTALLIWPDYRALVAGLLASAIAAVIASYALHPFRPRPGFGAFREISGFSKWMIATNLLMFAQRRADTFIIGKTLGLTVLGFQALAMELANLVATEFATPLQRAFMPGYSKLQSDLRALRQQFAAAYAAAMTIAIPVAVGVGSVAEPAVRLAFGETWLPSVGPLQVLAFYGLATASAVFCRPVVVALGAPRRLAPLQLVTLLLGAPAIYAGSLGGGLIGAAWAMAAMATLYALLSMRLVLKLTNGASIDVLRWMPRSLAAALAMAVAVRIVLDAFGPIGTGVAALHALGLGVGVGAATYCAGLFAIWQACDRPEGPEATLLRMAMRTVPTRFTGGRGAGS